MTQSNIISCFAWFMEDRSQRWSLHNDLGSGSSNHHHHRPHGVKELWFWLLENMRKNGLSLIILWNWGTNNHNIQRKWTIAAAQWQTAFNSEFIENDKKELFFGERVVSMYAAIYVVVQGPPLSWKIILRGLFVQTDLIDSPSSTH